MSVHLLRHLLLTGNQNSNSECFSLFGGFKKGCGFKGNLVECRSVFGSLCPAFRHDIDPFAAEIGQCFGREFRSLALQDIVADLGPFQTHPSRTFGQYLEHADGIGIDINLLVDLSVCFGFTWIGLSHGCHKHLAQKFVIRPAHLKGWNDIYLGRRVLWSASAFFWHLQACSYQFIANDSGKAKVTDDTFKVFWPLALEIQQDVF